MHRNIYVSSYFNVLYQFSDNEKSNVMIVNFFLKKRQRIMIEKWLLYVYYLNKNSTFL